MQLVSNNNDNTANFRVDDKGNVWVSSLYISDVTDKSHDHVLRDIEKRFKINSYGIERAKREALCGIFYKEQPIFWLLKEIADKYIYKYKECLSYRTGELLLKEMLEGTFLDNVKYQYKVLNYKVDFYIPYLDLIIEYDEDYHKYQKEEDIIRMDEILEELKRISIEEGNTHLIHIPANKMFTVIRIKQGEEFTVINKVLKHSIENMGMLEVLIK